MLGANSKNKKNTNHSKQNGVIWGRVKQAQIFVWLQSRIKVGINLEFVRKIYICKDNVRIATKRIEIDYTLAILVEESWEYSDRYQSERKENKRCKENSWWVENTNKVRKKDIVKTINANGFNILIKIQIPSNLIFKTKFRYTLCKRYKSKTVI